MAPLVDELHSVKAPGSTLVTAVGTCPSPTQPIGLRDTGSSAFWNDKLQSFLGRQIFIVLVFTAPSLFCLNLPQNPVRNGRCQRTPTAARLNQGNITAVRTVTQDYLYAMGGAGGGRKEGGNMFTTTGTGQWWESEGDAERSEVCGAA